MLNLEWAFGDRQRVSGAEAAEPTRQQQAIAERLRSSVEVERLLVERATAEYEKRFPSGQFVEEVESIAIRALVVLGRRDEAARDSVHAAVSRQPAH